MKNLYLFSILLVWTLCLPAVLSAQTDGANRIAAIRARLDTLTRRDEAYLGEVDLSVGEAPLSELLRSVAQVGGVNLSVRDGANLTVSCNFTRARIDELLLFLCEQYGLDVQVIGNIVSVFPYKAPVAPPPEPSVRFDRSDSTLDKSNASLYSDMTTKGFLMIGIRGNNIFPKKRYRLDYRLYVYTFPSYLWGFSYPQSDNDDNKSDMKRWQVHVKGSFLWNLGSNLFLGPSVAYDYIIGKDIERPELLAGMDRHTDNYGVGFTFMFDNRDNLTYPHRGYYVNLTQMFRPRFMGNDYAFSTTELQLNAYQQPWRGAVLAEDLRSTLNFGNPSWGMMAQTGGSNALRGYYEGRYRDKHMIEATVELRQHVWKRNSLTAWIGAGTVFPKFSQMRSRHILPNYGVGYRWEFKKNVNVRLDYGFGKGGQRGFLFNINEAF